MRARARRERFILRERRYCRRHGFCRFCIRPDVKAFAAHALYLGFLVDQLEMRLLAGLPSEAELMARIFPEREPARDATGALDASTPWAGPLVTCERCWARADCARLGSCQRMAADPVQSASPSPDRPGTGH